MADAKLLRIYLNDHLAAATAAPRLARRAAKANRGSELGRFLGELAAELDDDRQALEAAMKALGVRRNRAKQAAAVAAERLGLLKLNGRVVSYSPLSRVLELEGLALLAAFGAKLWRTLGEAARAERAERAAARLDELRAAAAGSAFGDSTPPPRG